MRYLLLIYGDESNWGEISPEDQAVEMRAWNGYTEWLREKGWLLGGEALQPTPTARTVRERDSEILTVDGPFAETKEQLGGYYLIQAEGMDEAIEAASRIPSVGRGSIEIRPIQEFSDTPS